MMWLPRITATVALILVGCDRPTGPEARDMAAEIEAEAGRGDFSRIRRMLPLTAPAGYLQGSRKVHRNRAVIAVRNGRADTLSGFVLENVYLPPAGYGVPLIRRSLVGWDDEWQYGFVAISEAHPGSVGRSDPSLPHSMYPQTMDSVLGPPPAFLRVTRHEPGASWLARGGVVDIRNPVIDRECEVDRDPLGGVDGLHTNVTCEWALFEVKVEGSFIRESDAGGLLPDHMKPRQRLEIPAQRVPGVRFTTQCRDFRNDIVATLSEFSDPCFHNWYRWWRDNRLFADSLGIDVAQMRRTEGENSYRRVLRPGVRGDVPRLHKYRWTIRTPDGTVLRRDSTRGLDPTTGALIHVSPMGPVGRISWGEHVQVIVQATDVGLSRSFYAMVIVDVELGPW